MDSIRELMGTFITILYIAILGRVIVDWLTVAGVVKVNPSIRYVLFRVTEPVLAPLRRFARIGMIDLSPMAAIFILMFIQQILAEG